MYPCNTLIHVCTTSGSVSLLQLFGMHRWQMHSHHYFVLLFELGVVRWLLPTVPLQGNALPCYLCKLYRVLHSMTGAAAPTCPFCMHVALSLLRPWTTLVTDPGRRCLVTVVI